MLGLFNREGSLPYADDRRLARRMLRGDEQAMRTFIDTYFPRLYRFALQRTGRDAMQAEDIVQETLTIAARRIETYRGEASLVSWLTQICQRELGRQMKRRQRRDNVVSLLGDDEWLAAMVESADDGGNDPQFGGFENQEVIEAVHFVLDNLPNRYGDLLEWKYIEGLSIKEIQEKVDLSSEAVQSLLARARRAFKSGFTAVAETGFQRSRT